MPLIAGALTLWLLGCAVGGLFLLACILNQLLRGEPIVKRTTPPAQHPTPTTRQLPLWNTKG
jgi:hypothetical protein